MHFNNLLSPSSLAGEWQTQLSRQQLRALRLKQKQEQGESAAGGETRVPQKKGSPVEGEGKESERGALEKVEAKGGYSVTITIAPSPSLSASSPSHQHHHHSDSTITIPTAPSPFRQHHHYPISTITIPIAPSPSHQHHHHSDSILH